MGCASCSNSGGVPRGCKNNGTCSSGGCNKLGVFDWLANMSLPAGQSQFDIVEVRFKNSRKAFFRNSHNLPLHVGDVVVVEASPGHDVGVVSIVGELVRIQLKKKAPGFKPHEARKIYRKAAQEDIALWKEARDLEFDTMHRARKLAISLNLDMKISDVEYQGDKTKATFFYTAEGRIDFRQLIKDLADSCKVRVEMRQIGARQEASRLGGIGSCGRELCCSTWLTDFRSVSTSAARYQQLSLNPQKLAGQCGKLKCCLNYELDMYLEALKEFPSTETRLHTKKGTGSHVKTDVFKRQLWYWYDIKEGEVGTPGLISLTPERVSEVIQLNKSGEKPNDLKEFQESVIVPKPDYTNVVGQDSLDRFDDLYKKKKKKKKKPSNSQTPQGTNNAVPRKEGEKKIVVKAAQNKANITTEAQAPKVENAAPKTGEAGPRPANKRRNNRNRNRKPNADKGENT